PRSALDNLRDIKAPVENAFNDLKDVVNDTQQAQNDYSKSLDKLFQNQPPTIPGKEDVVRRKPEQVNKAIAMHLLREGHFDVADTFIKECQQEPGQLQSQTQTQPQQISNPHPAAPTQQDDGDIELPDSDSAPAQAQEELSTEQTKQHFEQMYEILAAFNNHDLLPAIQWAQANAAILNEKRSDLAFELCRLQYLYLFQGEEHLEQPLNQRRMNAILFGRAHFHSFVKTHSKELRELVTAMAFASNLRDSPYGKTVYSKGLWREAARKFTRDYCAVKGIASQSPLYVAVTAGAIAMPTLVKLQRVMKCTAFQGMKEDQFQLPIDIPLPEMFRYHPTFVCPVSRQPSTEDNHPMMIPCGHAISKSSIDELSEASNNGRFKCPYCPRPAQPGDAKRIFI
ncbi:hypothetical protein KEM55_006820, partial [Ascosphaera atra]